MSLYENLKHARASSFYDTLFFMSNITKHARAFMETLAQRKVSREACLLKYVYCLIHIKLDFYN